MKTTILNKLFAVSIFSLRLQPRILLRSMAFASMIALLFGATPGYAQTIDGGSTVNVQGTSWGSGGALFVGFWDSGTLNISHGGAVNNNMAYIAYYMGSRGDATVDGEGSTWVNSTGLHIAYHYDTTGTLAIINGGAVFNTTGMIASYEGSQGTVTVDGAGSIWTNSVNIYVGDAGSGTLTISNGGTVVSDWTVEVAASNLVESTINIGAAQGSAAVAPGTLVAPSVALRAKGSLVFNHTDTSGSYTFSPVISGQGSVTHVAGYTTLTGNHSYTGKTTVTGGTLNVMGSTASGITTVGAGATLTGKGSIGRAGSSTTIETGGTFIAGDSTPGTYLTVWGTLTFEDDAQYVVNVNPGNASWTEVKGTPVLGGTATLDGIVKAIYADGDYVDKRYNILETDNGVSGTFSDLVNINLPSGFLASLDYDDKNVYLVLELSFDPLEADLGGRSGGLDENQQNVADSLTDYFDRTGGIPVVFAGLTPDELTQASGELATGVQQATYDAMSQFIGVMTDAGWDRTCINVDTGSNAHRPVGCPGLRRNVWAAVYGGNRTTDGNGKVGSHKATHNVYGAVAGIDDWVSSDTNVGFALSIGGTNVDLTDGLGSGRSNLLQAGAFIRHNMGAAYVSGALAYGWQSITTNRTVSINGGNDRLRARFNAHAVSGRVEGGYRFGRLWGGITPYAAGQVTTLKLPDYSEKVLSGTDTFALDYAGKTRTVSRSELGARADHIFPKPDGLLSLRGQFGWAHNFEGKRKATGTFQKLPDADASFVVNGAAIDSNTVLAAVSLERKWKNGWSVGVSVDGELGSATRSYGGRGVVRYQW